MFLRLVYIEEEEEERKGFTRSYVALFRLLYGAVRSSEGSMIHVKENVNTVSPASLIEHKAGFISENVILSSSNSIKGEG